MDSQSFQNLLMKIKSHLIFQLSDNKPQALVELQLAIFYK